jgi:RND family efflux transporter MFP subunit
MPQQGLRWTVWLPCLVLTLGIVVGSRYVTFREEQPEPVHAQEENEDARRATPSYVEVVHPGKGEERTTSQPGTIQAYESVQLYSAVSGYLKKQHVDIGDRVKRGQVLAIIAVPELEKQILRYEALVEQAKARVSQMNARLETAKAELNAVQASVTQAEATAKSAAATLRFRNQQLQRMRNLFDLKSIDERLVDETKEKRDAALETERATQAAILTTRAQVAAAAAKIEQAKADIIEAQAEVRVAEAELAKAKVMEDYATICAPFDGIVTHRSLFEKDFVRAATEGGAHIPLLTVQRTDVMRVIVQIPDRDVPYADPGDPAEVHIDALPGRKFPAKISRIASSEDPDTRLMRVELDLPNPPPGLIRNGMYGRVIIVLDKAADQLSIPSSCLAGRSADGKGAVYVVRGGHACKVPVDIGADNGVQVAINSGLKRTDEVIRHPGNGIAEGASVIVSNPEVDEPAPTAAQKD